MKKTISLFLLTLLLLFNCSSNRYLLSDLNNDKNFLNQKIKKFKKSEEISSKPLIVVDGIPYRYSYELKEEKLKISKSDIEKIDILKKDVGIRIYGEFAEGGVLLITTKSEALKNKNSKKPESSSLEESNVLVLVDGKEFPKEDLEKINPDNVQTITVIKDKKEIKKYTNKECDGIIIIEMKQ